MDNQKRQTEAIHLPLLEASQICMDYMVQKQSLSIGILKEFMEPAFLKTGYRESDNPPALTENILVIRLDEIGDNVLTSGFLRELRRNCPRAQITLVVNYVVAPLYELCPYVNEVLAFSVVEIQDFTMRFEKAVAFCQELLWKRHYDRCFLPRWDIDGYFATFLAYLSGARERIGYSASVYDGRLRQEGYVNELLTTAVVNPSEIVHEAARNFWLLQALGMGVANRTLEVWFDKSDLSKMRECLKNIAGKGKIIAVGTGGSYLGKMYPLAKFLQVLQRIKEQGYFFLLLGGKKEMEYNSVICEALGKDFVCDITGAVSLRETCAAISLASMYVGTDTGVKHIAAALRLPVLEINCMGQDFPKDKMSYVSRFSAYQVPTIVVRPKHSLSPCTEAHPFNGCLSQWEPHCIVQIAPEEIAVAFGKLRDMEYVCEGNIKRNNRVH